MPTELACLCHAPTATGALPAGEVRFMLRGLNAVSGSKSTEGEPPARVKIANWGKEVFRGGEVLVNAEAVAEIRRRMAANRQDRVRIDIVHKTAFRPQDQIEPENILGYGDFEDVPGEGLYLCNIAWTDRGRQIWRALPDPSPAFLCRKGDHLMTQLDSVGLCPDGELELPTLCSASGPVPGDGIILKSALTESTMIKLLQALLAKAGVTVPEQGTMTDAEYEQALTAAAADYLGKEESTEEMEAKKVCAAKPADITALQRRIDEQERKLSAVLNASDTAAREEIVRQCSAEGKVIPLSDDHIYGRNGETAIALSALRAMAASLPQTVRVNGGKPAPGDKTTPAKADTYDEEQIKCMAAMGVTPDEVKKFGAAA